MERAGRDVARVPRSRRPEPDPPVEATDDEVEPPVADVPADEASTVDAGDAPGLTERQRAIVDFERQWWKHAGAKEQAIRDEFQLSTTRYYQLLNAVLDEPAALAYDPVTVQRLRRLRSARVRSRGTRR